MACKRLIIKKNACVYTVFCGIDSQSRQWPLNCAKFLGTINTHAHTNTLFSLVHTRQSGYLHETVEPRRRGP